MPFSPSDISGLKVWLKEGISGSDGDPVGTWSDSSGLANDFTASGTERPLLKKTIRNGLDVVRFDGSNDYLEGGDLQAEFGNSAASVFVAYAPNSDNKYSLLINSDNDSWWMHDSGPTPYQGLFRTARISGFAASTPTNGWHIFTLVTGSDYRVWVDGTADSGNPQTASWDNGTTIFKLGGRSADDPQAQNRHMTGDVGEVIIYDTALSTQDRQSVEAYLIDKWGPPSVNHLVDALITNQQTKTQSVDALINKTQTKTHLVDAITKKTLTKTQSIDALLVQQRTKTGSVDALTQKTQTKTQSVDALLNKTQTKTQSVDALILKTQTKTQSVDALLKKTLTKTQSSDVLLKKTLTNTHSVDALLRIGTSVFMEIDALTKKTLTKTSSIDALTSQTFNKTQSIDAITNKTQTKTGSIDASLSSGLTKSSLIDALLKKVQTNTTAIDELLLKVNTKTGSVDTNLSTPGVISHSADAFLSVHLTKTTSIDEIITRRTTKTSSVDGLLSTAPWPSSAKTHFVDALKIKSGTVFSYVDALLFNSQSTKVYAVDALLYETTTVPGDIAAAFQGSIVRPGVRLSRVISRNSAIGNVPTITVSDAGDAAGNLEKSLIDGFNRSPMKFAFADSDATTNDDYRVFPDFDKYETEQYLEKQKIPWVSQQLSSTSGALTPVVITIQYTGTNQFNMVEIVTDKWGKGSAGIITDMTIEVSTNGSSWTTIGSGQSGFSCPEPHRYQLFHFNSAWSTDKAAFLEAANDVVTFAYLRFTINSISVDMSASSADRARHLLLYEAGSYFWDVGIQDVNITSFSINEDRDLSSQTLSPIGSSSANTFSLTGTVAGKTLPYYSTLIDPYSANHDQYQNALYIATVGVKVGSVYEYLDYGYFLADELNISAPDGTMNISGRDFSKVLQETKMPPVFYEDKKLHEIIHDIIQRAGIEKYDIDITEYTIKNLAPYIEKEWVSNDDYLDVHQPNLIWSNEQTCWEFLQTIAYADLGVFYFDRTNTFIYRAKEDLIRTDGYPIDFDLSEDFDILSTNTTNEIMKNSFKISYSVPKMTKGTTKLWEAENQTLSTTSLTANIDAVQTDVPVGDIKDWQEQGYFQIDNEIIKYKDRTGNTFQNCERGWLGTQAVAHTMSNSSANWNFNVGTWSVSGGVLSATSQGASWGDALTASIIDSNRYNFVATVTINEDPYAAAMLVRAFGSNNHYRFVFKTVKFPGYPGVTASESNIYALYEVVGGTPNLLKSISYNDARNVQLTGVPFQVKAQVDAKQLTFWVGGTRVMHYNIQDTDLQIAMPAKVGFGAKGAGPTVFENAYVATLPDDTRGQTVIFTETFGKPIYEIRKYEVDYSPGDWAGNRTTTPASAISYVATNSDEFSIIDFEPGPFSAKMYVKNNVDRITVVAGTGGDEDSQVQTFYMVGYALYHNDKRDAERENESLITRYGRQEFVADLPWVESDTHAKILLKYVENLYEKPTLFLDIGIAPTPSIELGDIISLTSTGDEIWFPAGSTIKFFVVGNQISIDKNGIQQSIKVRNIIE